jgi:hypothetical protein
LEQVLLLCLGFTLQNPIIHHSLTSKSIIFSKLKLTIISPNPTLNNTLTQLTTNLGKPSSSSIIVKQTSSTFILPNLTFNSEWSKKKGNGHKVGKK